MEKRIEWKKLNILNADVMRTLGLGLRLRGTVTRRLPEPGAARILECHDFEVQQGSAIHFNGHVQCHVWVPHTEKWEFVKLNADCEVWACEPK